MFEKKMKVINNSFKIFNVIIYINYMLKELLIKWIILIIKKIIQINQMKKSYIKCIGLKIRRIIDFFLEIGVNKKIKEYYCQNVEGEIFRILYLDKIYFKIKVN